MKIVKVYREIMPKVKLSGKRYTDADRDESGTFAGYWQQWFGKGWFDTLKQRATDIPYISDDYLGAMRMTGNDGGGFEYWIGAFYAPDSDVPDGFESVEIAAGDVGVCWLSGDEKSGELYGTEAPDLSMAAMKEKGWEFSSEYGWFFERNNCPHFTVPDENGNVILDICSYLPAVGAHSKVT